MEKISLFSYNVEDEYKKIEKAFPDLDINTGIIPLDYLEKTDFLKDLEKIYTTKETEKFKNRVDDVLSDLKDKFEEADKRLKLEVAKLRQRLKK